MVNVVSYNVTPSSTAYIDLGKVEFFDIRDTDGDGSNDYIGFQFESGKLRFATANDDGFYHLLDDVTAWLEESMKS